jgi:hypothetical protein
LELDLILENLDIIKNAWIDRDFVYLCGKIGENSLAVKVVPRITGILSGILEIILKLFMYLRFIGKGTKVFKTRREEIWNITI